MSVVCRMGCGEVTRSPLRRFMSENVVGRVGRRGQKYRLPGVNPRLSPSWVWMSGMEYWDISI